MRRNFSIKDICVPNVYEYMKNMENFMFFRAMNP